MGRQPVAHELLVETARVLARAPVGGVPEARGIRGQRLVDQRQRAVGAEAELELGVGDDHAAFGGMVARARVQLQARVAHLPGALPPEPVLDLGERDVLVVGAVPRLGRGREQRFGQALGQAQARRQRNAAHASGLLVVAPAGADQVAAHDGLHRQGLQAARAHAAPGQLRALGVVERQVVQGQIAAMVRQDLGEEAEPELRHPGQGLAFAGDRRRQHHVERRQSVGGHQQQVLGVDLVQVANLALAQAVQAGQVSAINGVHGDFNS